MVQPILLDSRPAYLGTSSGLSLLLLPFGAGTVVDHLVSTLREITLSPPVVISPPDADSDYAARIATAAPRARVLRDRSVTNLLRTLDPSDRLLLVDPRSFPIDGFEPQLLLNMPAFDPRWVVHYVSMSSQKDQTREYAEVDNSGRIRRVRRYYDAVTWPFITGVAASLLPVSALIDEPPAELELGRLRRRLVDRGVAAHDLLLPTTALDLQREAGLLSLIGHQVRRTAAARKQNAVLVGEGHRIHPTSRLIGPVIVHRDVVVEERATVMGPTVVGAGARIGRDAIVAQSVVTAGCVVPPGTTVDNRIAFEPLRSPSGSAARRGGPCELSPSTQVETSGSGPLRRSRYMAAKRVADTCIAAIALVVISPILLLIALAVALDSEGPIIYGHEREGLAGQRFRCLKFRSMQLGSEALERQLHAQNLVEGPQFKLERDPRVTRVGNLLRLTNLDELPQLINVIRGEMALVGPRPSPFNENQVCVPWRQGRLSVRPGITGLWQMCRQDRSQGDFPQWIEFDLLYVRHMSLMLDLRILIATVLTGGGQRSVPIHWLLPGARSGDAAPSRLIPV